MIDGDHGGMPFTFMQEEHLIALGVAKRFGGVAEKAPQFDKHHVATTFVPITVQVREAEPVFAVNDELLRIWKPPPDATDDYVLMVDDDPPAALKRSPTGTRIDALAAQALWALRAQLEIGYLLTRHAWCTHCGRHFEDQRRAHHVRVARWCPAHRNLRSRKLPHRAPVRRARLPAVVPSHEGRSDLLLEPL
jgi:hypothetical protein